MKRGMEHGAWPLKRGNQLLLYCFYSGVVIMMVTYGSSQEPQAVHSKVGEIVTYPTENYTFSFTGPTFTGASYNGSVTQLCKEIPGMRTFSIIIRIRIFSCLL